VDKSRKRKAMSHQPTSKPPAAPVLNNNVDDMYAKVQKNMSPARRSWNSKKTSDPAYETVPDPADNLPIGASAMRTSAEHLLGARPRLPPHHRHINYSDYEVAHYDPNTSKHANVTTTKNQEDQELGYETVPENRFETFSSYYYSVETSMTEWILYRFLSIVINFDKKECWYHQFSKIGKVPN
jgi:hypothetical protein